ncbi:hypothetical protein GOBAR_AA07050 [Gossypium barbadense]|uniref:Chlorophyll synthase n=1 Tax=Gossypium barbadense TaxID=3634 RepID=A0A2P5YD90_GOSBA|nr:hypothetical protein GOBAR_AA07050 [Gossypium barbadense]
MSSVLNTVSSLRLSRVYNSNNNNHLRLPTHSVLTPPPVSFTRRRLTIRAADTDTNEVKSKAPDKAPAGGGSSFNQLLGIKGAAQETVIPLYTDPFFLSFSLMDKWKIRLQLTKPVTWPPLVWGVVCGAAASGNFHWNLEDVAKEIDAINEPYRPIPSGAISENEVISQIWLLLLGGLGIAGLLDVWAGHDFPIVFYLALGGSLLSYIYSAPPLKLKQNGWIGNFALGASYISLPWWAGQALFGTLTPDIVVLTLLYSIAGSLPVAFGAETAKWICVGAIDITQLSIAGYLLGAGKPYYALALVALIFPQVVFQFQCFLKDPVKYDVKYQASAQPFLVLGLLVTALATSH